MKEIEGKTYKDRCNYQLEEWVRGNSIHNTIDDECCPDFSCCNKDMNTPIVDRKVFKALHDKEDDKQAQETKMGMLYGFLGTAIANYVPNKKVHIIDGNTEIKKDLN